MDDTTECQRGTICNRLQCQHSRGLQTAIQTIIQETIQTDIQTDIQTTVQTTVQTIAQSLVQSRVQYCHHDPCMQALKSTIIHFNVDPLVCVCGTCPTKGFSEFSEKHTEKIGLWCFHPLTAFHNRTSPTEAFAFVQFDMPI